MLTKWYLISFIFMFKGFNNLESKYKIAYLITLTLCFLELVLRFGDLYLLGAEGTQVSAWIYETIFLAATLPLVSVHLPDSIRDRKESTAAYVFMWSMFLATAYLVYQTVALVGLI